MPQNIQDINSVLRFPWRPNWPPGDPGPDWNQILSGLDPSAISQVAIVQVTLATAEIQAQKTVLDARLKALGAMQDIIKNAPAR